MSIAYNRRRRPYSASSRRQPTEMQSRPFCEEFFKNEDGIMRNFGHLSLVNKNFGNEFDSALPGGEHDKFFRTYSYSEYNHGKDVSEARETITDSRKNMAKSSVKRRIGDKERYIFIEQNNNKKKDDNMLKVNCLDNMTDKDAKEFENDWKQMVYTQDLKKRQPLWWCAE